jgi:hypothetical protein
LTTFYLIVNQFKFKNKTTILLATFFLFFQCYTSREIAVNTYSDNFDFLITGSADSIIPYINGITSLICNESNSIILDTLYLLKSKITLFDSSEIASITNCIKQNNKFIIFTDKYIYPYILLDAKIVMNKYFLNIGIMNGDLFGFGREYEIIKTGDKYILGKIVNSWIS